MENTAGVSRFSEDQWKQILNRNTCVHHGLWPSWPNQKGYVSPEKEKLDCLLTSITQSMLNKYLEPKKWEGNFEYFFHISDKTISGNYRICKAEFNIEKHELLEEWKAKADVTNVIGISTIALYQPITIGNSPNMHSFKLSFYTSPGVQAANLKTVLNNMTITCEEEFIEKTKSHCKLLEEFVFSVHYSFERAEAV